MTLEIDFLDETNQVETETITFLEELLVFALAKQEIDDHCELSVTFVNNERIREINREYRDKDQPTDVISFALEELGEGEVQVKGMNVPRVLGDIIISTEKAHEQAVEYGHSYKRELGFLAVHGLLHLLGYDHLTEDDEKLMFGLQKDILDAFGLQRD